MANKKYPQDRATETAGGPPSSGDVGRPAPAIFRFMNPVIRRLLRSPLHRLLSSQMMLLDYTGRVSGRTYTIPIGYFAWDGGGVVAVSGTRWWKNLRDGRPVSLLVRGVRHAAIPTVIESADSRADLFAEFVRRYGPKVAGRLQAGLPSDRDPTPDELRWAAATKMLIRFDPADSEPIA
jgi:hypothetical protein